MIAMNACTWCGNFVTQVNEKQMCTTCEDRDLVVVDREKKPDYLFERCSEVVERVYISDLQFARDKDGLKDKGISHIVDASRMPAELRVKGPVYLDVNVPDSSESNISAHFDRVNSFIATALQENAKARVLVHCAQGISRSCTLILAYMLHAKVPRKGMTPDEVLQHVKAKTSCVCPNAGFWSQLCEYHAAFGGPTVQYSCDYAEHLFTDGTYNDSTGECTKLKVPCPDQVQAQRNDTKTNEAKFTTDPRPKRRVNRDDFIAAGCTMSCPCRCYYCVNHVDWIYDEAPKEE